MLDSAALVDSVGLAALGELSALMLSATALRKLHRGVSELNSWRSSDVSSLQMLSKHSQSQLSQSQL